jgi:hypothetical protein
MPTLACSTRSRQFPAHKTNHLITSCAINGLHCRPIETNTSLNPNKIWSKSSIETSLDEKDVGTSCIGGGSDLTICSSVDAGCIDDFT